MSFRPSRILLWALLAIAPAAQAAQPAPCPEHFAGGKPPALLNPRLVAGTRPLCFGGFAVLHSAATRGPLYSAEHLTSDRIAAARTQPRIGQFHAEPALPNAERADLADYSRSGWDRGHMAPSGDMPDPVQQEESFTLANMIPQAPKLNRGLWEGIESAVRTLAGRRGELYVLTGPLFEGADLATIGHVLVPTRVWKAVLDPRRHAAAAYLATNDDSGAWQPVSVAELSRLTGLDLFPGQRLAVLQLPSPTPHGYDRQRNRALPGRRHNQNSGWPSWLN